MSDSQSSPVEATPGEVSPPERVAPAADQVDLALLQAVKDTLFALPARFKSTLNIEGVLATDLHAFNTSLGASIEEQVVAALNELKGAWDPDDKYPTHQFIRSPQRFPDVTLRNMVRGSQSAPLLGIELKGWYVLSKEGEPSGRYKVTPSACAPQDLLVIVPWALGNAVSGTPRLFTPYVESALYVAEYRNWWWQHKREAKTAKIGITSPPDATPYPAQKSDKISDVPEERQRQQFRAGAKAWHHGPLQVRVDAGNAVRYSPMGVAGLPSPFAGEAEEEDVRKGIARVAAKVKTELGAEDVRQEELTQAIIGIVRAVQK